MPADTDQLRPGTPGTEVMRESAVAVLGDLGGAGAIGLGGRRRFRPEPVDQSVVHGERGRDQNGKLHVRIRGAGRQRGLDVRLGQAARLAADGPGDVEQRLHLGVQAMRCAVLDDVDDRRQLGGAIAFQQRAANAPWESMQ